MADNRPMTLACFYFAFPRYHSIIKLAIEYSTYKRGAADQISKPGVYWKGLCIINACQET